MSNNLQTNIGMSVDAAEEKWHKAKAAVDKSKYDDDDTYYAVVTTVFKKMIGEDKTMELPTIKFFEQYIDELRDSEYNANRQMGGSSLPNVRHNAPFASINDKEERRKQELRAAVTKHIAKGQFQHAHDAAYKIAHAHAIEDHHGADAAHEIATRKAKYAIKRAQDAMKR
jgi:hypothetical protein